MALTYLPVGDQQLLDGLTLADSGVKDGLHVQLLQALMLLTPPAPEGLCVYWVYTCAAGVRAGSGSPEAYGIPTPRPEGRPKPNASISKSLASHLQAPPHPFSNVSSKLLH